MTAVSKGSVMVVRHGAQGKGSVLPGPECGVAEALG